MTRHVETICPGCGHRLDASTSPLDPGVAPKREDVSVCIECAQPFSYNADLSLRPLSTQELQTLPKEIRRCVEFMRKTVEERDESRMGTSGKRGVELMQTKEYRTIDKHEWPRGEWDDEPDKIQWRDPDTGLPCLFKRQTMCHLCGYVGIPPSHALYGKDCGDADADELAVHGGITYGAPCGEGPESESVCHVPGEGEEENVWWLGFDCAHAWDFSPGTPSRSIPFQEEGIAQKYKNVAFVKAECANLAKQLVEVATNGQ